MALEPHEETQPEVTPSPASVGGDAERKRTTGEIVALVNRVAASLGGVYEVTGSAMVTMGVGVLAVVALALFLTLHR